MADEDTAATKLQAIQRGRSTRLSGPLATSHASKKLKPLEDLKKDSAEMHRTAVKELNAKKEQTEKKELLKYLQTMLPPPGRFWCQRRWAVFVTILKICFCRSMR